MNKIKELDMGDVISVRGTLCHTLPVYQHADGVYRNLEISYSCFPDTIL